MTPDAVPPRERYVRLCAEHHRRLAAEAERERRSLTGQLEVILNRHFAQKPPKG